MSTKYDILINGAGMVGAVTALLMAEQKAAQGADKPIKIAVIESRSETKYQPNSEHQMRVSAVSWHNLKLFKRLGLDRHWIEDRMGYYHHMKVWDNQSTGELEFNRDSHQPLGAMVENDQLIAVAQQLIHEHPHITVHYDTTIECIEQTERKVKVKLKNGNEMEGSLLIGADGAGSMVRKAMNIEWQTKSYRQHGLVCYLRLEDAPESTALQAFNAGGPVGLLPMNGGLFSMVWSLPDGEAKHWLEADELHFINGVKAHINRNFGAVELASRRATFPLQQANAQAYHQARVVLVGDAAHTIHPLAGQGVNLGFADAECLAEKLSQVNLKDRDALARKLRKYQRVRKAQVSKTSETMHALHHLFTHSAAPLKPLRAFGMNQLNRIQPLKSWLLKQAGS